MPQVEALAKENDNIVLRLIDITDSNKRMLPVMKQHGVQTTPHFVLLDENGSVLNEGKTKIWKEIQNEY